ncbi:MAG: DNA polymerase III, subunit gamma and tau [Candidatus Terrybacteria bacterium RIFCSPHIGHO2_01_FULL_58_15]|nr:MAG: DNA polymerase III, subunit gamma and tau [Candidatus Terrybacteria bacterium RIFCSPHIGHO2_01_FULL_58_15]
MALVLYRKYRPKSFEELVGQEHVVGTLRNALRLGRIGHAYLFVGPRGTGKTTVARLLAKSVNCERGAADGDACNACIQCQAFLASNHPDLVEVDAASNRGVDEIRQLREGARVTPLQAQRKVYVIDEAHMLTQPAVNALLKILEEPPQHVIFVLATTDVEKLPVTILSRCQRFDFRLLTIPEITGRLQSLAAAEHAAIDADAIDLLAQAADGSVRDGESLLEQVLAFLGERATRDEVTRLLGIPDPLVVREIADALFSGDAARALEGVASVMERGGDATVLATRLASYLRDVLLLNADPNLGEIIERRSGAAHIQGALAHAQEADQRFLLKAVPKFIDAVELTKRSPIPQLPIELAIVEMTASQSEISQAAQA